MVVNSCEKIIVKTIVAVPIDYRNTSTEKGLSFQWCFRNLVNYIESEKIINKHKIVK